jgi:hypothetical protein
MYPICTPEGHHWPDSSYLWYIAHVFTQHGFVTHIQLALFPYVAIALSVVFEYLNLLRQMV